MKKLVLAIALLCLPSIAEARTHLHRQQPCGGFFQPPCANRQWFTPRQQWFMPFEEPRRAIVVPKRRHRKEAKVRIPRERPNSIRIESADNRIVSHPDGCPRHAFCGCGAAVHVFGQAVRNLWLAANWFHFPHVPHEQAQPGMVAVSRHHVFVLESKLDRDTWLSYDANSGRGLTRIHPRALRGYVVVDPHRGT